ncbi:MAG: hypothetical protein KBA53_01960 [Thermoclostridium sp.]|nr:hypothetical protein [Thermoclostridium sp.]
MLKNKKTQKAFIFLIIFASILTSVFPYQAISEVQPIEEVEGKIREISEVEKAVLEDLFTLSQQIDEMEKKETQINEQIDKLETELETLSERIVQNQESYELQRDVLKRVLINYQKRGPASYLETFLSAGNLTTFLKSLNILKDMSRNSKKLLASITEAKKQLEAEKEQLAQKQAQVVQTKQELEKAISELLVLKKEQQKILASLADQRETFEQELNYIETMWDEIKVLFGSIIDYFNTIVVRGNLPLDKLNLKLEFPRVRGTLTDEVLNEVLASQPDLPVMYFHFHPEIIDVEVPEKQLALKCHFIIEDKSSITFIIDEGTFYGMPLTESSIGELLENGTLRLDFKELMGFITVESAQTFEGYMDFVIAPILGD